MSKRLKELDVVVLSKGAPEFGLTAGAIGTIVHEHATGKDFMVEFFDDARDTLCVESFSGEDLRAATKADLKRDKSPTIAAE